VSKYTRYAIIGTGNVGSALAVLFAHAGIDVSIANTRGPETIRPLADTLGRAVRPATVQEALKSDVIIMAIGFGAVAQFGSLLPDWHDKIVVDTSNAHWTPGWEQMVNGRPSAQYTAEQVPGARVVKSFNQLPANVLASRVDPAVGKRVVFVSSDSPDASQEIAALVTELGFSAVELGRTDEGGLLIQTPNALVLRQFIELPFR
jgi:predicted dinucleotide-binding enzyme